MTSFINFCEKKSIKLKSFEIKEIDQQLHKYYSSNENNIYKLNNIQEINSKYLLTISKKNILKFKLLLTKMFNKNYCIFIFQQNNNLYYFNIKFRFNELLYNGTLFNGEMVKNKCRGLYLKLLFVSITIKKPRLFKALVFFISLFLRPNII